MRNKEDFMISLIKAIIILTMVILFLGILGLEIYIYITYSNTPVSELPSWVIFFMFGVKR